MHSPVNTSSVAATEAPPPSYTELQTGRPPPYHAVVTSQPSSDSAGPGLPTTVGRLGAVSVNFHGYEAAKHVMAVNKSMESHTNWIIPLAIFGTGVAAFATTMVSGVPACNALFAAPAGICFGFTGFRVTQCLRHEALLESKQTLAQHGIMTEIDDHISCSPYLVPLDHE